MKMFCAVGVALLSQSLVLADDKTPHTANPTVVLTARPMPAIDVSSQPLEKVLEALNAKEPDFHFVIFRAPGVSKDSPVLPPMKLQDVTIGQFLTLIDDAMPSVHIKKINGQEVGGGEKSFDDKNLYEVNIMPAESAPVAPAQVLKVFSLASIIANSSSPADPKKAMNDVLSLVQATMEEAPGDPKEKMTLKVHEPTQTLVFKGSPEKMAVLEQLLVALEPKESDQLHKAQRQADDEHQRLQEAQASMARMHTQEMDLQSELVKTRAELKQATEKLNASQRSTTRP